MSTPMLRQYDDLRAQHPGCLLLMRCGDFYEAYGEDARTLGTALDIVVTSKEAGNGTRTPMAGFPHFAVDNFLRTLIAKGFRVAIADQMEDPKQAKGLVRRDITRVVSSGTVLDPQLLDEKAHNYVAAPVKAGPQWGLALADVSTGEFVCTTLAETAVLLDELQRWRPAELVMVQADEEVERLVAREGGVITRWQGLPSAAAAEGELRAHYGLASLEGLGLSDALAIVASGLLLRYVKDTQKAAAVSLSPPGPYYTEQCLIVDPTSARNLEITETYVGRERKGSLLWAMDETATAMGARLLRQWLERPLIDLSAIERRLDAVEEFTIQREARDEVRERLHGIVDIPRLLSRVVYGTATGRDLLGLAQSLRAIRPILDVARRLQCPLLVELAGSMADHADVADTIERAVNPQCPAQVRDGNVIKDGWHAELDELRAIRGGARSLIGEMEERERGRTGIKSLKVGFNQVFGYYIEVTRANLGQVPDDYVRKQTLANGERYISDELKEYEARYLGAQERIVGLETELFAGLRSGVAEAAPAIRKTALGLAHLDVLAGLAWLAVKHRYSRPEVSVEPILELMGARHPVVERMLDGRFVPNDAYLDQAVDRLMILTGPNMAGKSTYLRQTALLTVMAQMGSFVPADRARIGLADRVFTRVGASDDLRLGRSTFLVEMSEVANILNNATERSVVILDEVGRGTSTHDGLSLAWAIAEHLHNVVGSRTLFATHYHELTRLATVLPGVRNYRVAVRELGNEVIFLYRILPGASDRSYGIHVARLAGVPAEVLVRAEDLLADFERGQRAAPGPRRSLHLTRTALDAQLELFAEPQGLAPVAGGRSQRG
ncbi:MAG TPA: DNA mismatch repair protein MutS [Candidatus Xenobia bacterium]